MADTEIRKKVTLEFGGKNEAAKAAIAGAASAATEMQEKLRQESRETAATAKQAAAISKQAAKEQRDAEIAWAREAASIAKQAAKESADAAKRSAMGVGDVFREMMKGATDSSRALRNAWQGVELVSGAMGKLHFAIGLVRDIAEGVEALADNWKSAYTATEQFQSRWDELQRQAEKQMSGEGLREMLAPAVAAYKEVLWEQQKVLQNVPVILTTTIADAQRYADAAKRQYDQQVADRQRADKDESDRKARAAKSEAAEAKRAADQRAAAAKSAHDEWMRQEKERIDAIHAEEKAYLEYETRRKQAQRELYEEWKRQQRDASLRRVEAMRTSGIGVSPESLAFVPNTGRAYNPGRERSALDQSDQDAQRWANLRDPAKAYEDQLNSLAGAYDTLGAAAGKAFTALITGQSSLAESAGDMVKEFLRAEAARSAAMALESLGLAAWNVALSNWAGAAKALEAAGIFAAFALAYGAGAAIAGDTSSEKAAAESSASADTGRNTSGYESGSSDGGTTIVNNFTIGSGFTTEREVRRGLSDALEEAHQKGYLVSRVGAARRRN